MTRTRVTSVVGNMQFGRRSAAVIGLAALMCLSAGVVVGANPGNRLSSRDSAGVSLALKESSPTGVDQSNGAILIVDGTPWARSDIFATLMQSSYSADGVAFDLLLTPFFYFEMVERPDQGIEIGADKYVVFLLAEHHAQDDSGHLGHFGLMPILKIDGKDVHVAGDVIELTNDGHHRTTALVFEELLASMLDEVHTWEMILPPDANNNRATMIWTTPIEFLISGESAS